MLRKQLSLTIIPIVIIGLFIYITPHFATQHSVTERLASTPQNALVFVNPHDNLVLKPGVQIQYAHAYLEHYFSPWNTRPTRDTVVEIKQALISSLDTFTKDSGFGPNTHRYSINWIKNITQNMNLANYPNSNQDAIVIHDSNVRILPTYEPSFTDRQSLSKGYPFDNIQQSYISSGTPIHIIQTSKDQLWSYIIAASYGGWLPTQDIANASPAFKQQWQTNRYVVSRQDNIPLYDNKNHMALKTRIGIIYPVNDGGSQWQILIPSILSNGKAIIKHLNVDKKLLNAFPLSFSQQEVAHIANNLLEKPYGWGGMYGYRDCSATTRDIMANFGIWLPRNSSDQTQVGTTQSLTHLNNSDKENWLIKQAIPFATILHLPGHVMLYIGQINGHAIVFQDMWGIHTYKFLNSNDRVVVGKTIISPLNFAGYFFNSSLNQLSATDSATTLIRKDQLEKTIQPSLPT